MDILRLSGIAPVIKIETVESQHTGLHFFRGIVGPKFFDVQIRPVVLACQDELFDIVQAFGDIITWPQAIAQHDNQGTNYTNFSLRGLGLKSVSGEFGCGHPTLAFPHDFNLGNSIAQWAVSIDFKPERAIFPLFNIRIIFVHGQWMANRIEHLNPAI